MPHKSIVIILLYAYSVYVAESDRNGTDIFINFSCPPNESIHPCMCHLLQPIPAVQCANVSSLKVMHQALSNHFRDVTIPFLQIQDCNFMGLPARAFSNLSMTRLYISNTEFTFLSPDAFEGLDSLMLLSLHNVMLFHFPAEALSRLPNLMTLSLPENKMSKIEQVHFRSIGAVKSLFLGGNRIAHMERASFPIGLVTLDIAKNHLMTLNKTIRHLPYLETLFADENRLTNIEGELDGLYNLKSLYLSKNLLRTLGDSLRDLHKLKLLELQYNSIYDLGESLNGLTRLEFLNLSHNFLFRINPTAFQYLESLETLDLSGNRLISIDSALFPLVKLKHLYLSKNALYNFTFRDISTLHRLQELNIADNFLSFLSCDPNELYHQQLPLRTLILSKNQLHSLHDFLNHLPHLEVIDISYNLIQRIFNRYFEDMPRLDYINIQENPMTCDAHYLEVIRELESRRVEVIGQLNCSSTEPAEL